MSQPVSRLTASLRFTAASLRRTPTASRIPSARLLHVSSPRAQNAQQPTQNDGKSADKADASKSGEPDARDAEIERLKSEAVASKTKLAYALAEVHNVQRTAKLEHDKAVKFGIQDFTKDLLGVADNLDLCVSNFPKELLSSNKPLQDLHVGITMTQSELLKVLGKHGVERLHPLGQKFDTSTMNALMRMRDPSKTPGTVGMVTKTGYSLRGRVIRPADVAIVEPEPEAEKASQSSGNRASDVS